MRGLASGYWQVRVSKRNREKTAFVMPMRLFEFLHMSFGLTNAPTTFQQLMELCLGELNLEALLIIWKTFLSPHLRNTYRNPRLYGLTLRFLT